MCTQDMVHPDMVCEKLDCKKNVEGKCECWDRLMQHMYPEDE